MDEMTVDDLTRAVIREFLYEKKLFKTYDAFQEEDEKPRQKLSKNLIIKNLCLDHLVISNKKSASPFKTLLEVLVNYLKNRYLSKKATIARDKSVGKVESVTSENFYMPMTSQDTKHRKQNLIKTSMNFRPGSARKIKKPDVIEIAQTGSVMSRKNIQTSSTNYEQEEKNVIVEQVNLSASDKVIAPPPKSPQLAKTVSQGYNPQGQKQKPKAEKMISMFGKRKQEKKQQPQKVHQMFSTPLQQEVQPLKYVYEPMKFDPFVLKQQITTQLTYKKVTTPADKFKKKIKLIQEDVSSLVRKVLFQGNSKTLPKAWKQGILLSPFQKTYYGLRQLEGGPCAIIAALQCYFLKHLFYLSKQNPQNLEVRQNCLIAAISDMLYSINPNKVVLVIPSFQNTYAKDPISIQNVELLTLAQPKDIGQVYEAVYHHKSYYIGQNNSGYTLLLYSCILTKQVNTIMKQMDSPQTPLIGNHGHCNQQLVNMFITLKASTNIFNGIKVLGEDKDKIELKGVQQQSQFGFLTIFETLGYVEAGTHLKNPVFPIWIICKQFHYHVIFAGNYLISENNKTQKLDLVYFDGLYNCGDKIILTLSEESKSNEKVGNLPLIQQVILTKWGRREVDWNGSIKIL